MIRALIASALLFISQAISTGHTRTVSGGGPSVYLNTLFNEAVVGTPLAGTVPTICTASTGCTWVLAGGSDFTYFSGGGIATSVPATNSDVINTGHADETIRISEPGCTPNGGGFAFCQFNLRRVDSNNFVAINVVTDDGGGSQKVDIFDVVAGSATMIGTLPGGPITGNFTFVQLGNSITITSPNGSTTVTTANTTGTLFGLFAGSNLSLMNPTLLSAKSF